MPAVAVQEFPLSPPLAVSVTDAPGASDVVLVSDHTVVPSMKNATSRIVPAGVAAVPWFFTVALGTTLGAQWPPTKDSPR